MLKRVLDSVISNGDDDMTHEYDESEMLVIDRIVDAGGDWPSQAEVAAALDKLYEAADQA